MDVTKLREDAVAVARGQLDRAITTTQKHEARKALKTAARALEALKAHEQRTKG